jgi:ABC-type transport system involved in multi-copper enzyme maturation permease subunit
VSPISEVRLVAQRELRKSFRSAKGIVLLVLSLLGGTAIAQLLVWIEKLKREQLADVNPETVRSFRVQALTKAFSDEATGKALADVPEVLLAMFFITVWLTPMLISLLGFDSVSADVQHRTVRYWTLRTRRPSYVIGKWLGLWTTVSIITLTMHVVIWVLCVARGQGTAAMTFGWGVRLWLISLPMSAVWSAVATLVSSMFRTPIVALLSTFAAFFFLFIVWVIGVRYEVDALVYVYPNAYDSLLIHQRADKFLKGLAGCIAMVIAYMGVTTVTFARRDV